MHIDDVNMLWQNNSMQTARRKSAEPDTYHHGDLRRSLIEAAVAMASEKQDWTFSLREVARRAGVSHNAPYNHFQDKRDLMAAVAAAGYNALRDCMKSAIAGIEKADAALFKSGVEYVKFGLDHPTHYRLMFSSALAATQEVRPEQVKSAAAEARSVLEDVLRRGARTGVFPTSFQRKDELMIATLTAWSAVHGFTMIAIDDLIGVPRPLMEHASERLVRTVVASLRA
jgi:AcrR family transcriptional regulator